MATRGAQSKAHGGNAAVAQFMAALDHPHKAGIEVLRSAILSAESDISEEIKWNAPSFKLHDHFATIKLYPPKNIQLVLHTGAKPAEVSREFKLAAPSGLLKWAAPDRCVITIKSSAQATELQAVVVSLIRQWLSQL